MTLNSSLLTTNWWNQSRSSRQKHLVEESALMAENTENDTEASVTCSRTKEEQLLVEQESPVYDDRKIVNQPSSRPSLYDETMEMMAGALLIYIFADLREMAREGVMEELLQAPLSISQVVQAIQNHKQALIERAMDHKGLEERLHALKDMKESQAENMMDAVLGRPINNDNNNTSRNDESVLAHFCDRNAKDGGVVYGIAINPVRRRVTVCFRGSVTQHDFIADANITHKKIDNPVFPLAMETDKTISIHAGFHRYLFTEDNEGQSRLAVILGRAKQLLKENSGYRLNCTGHSLGGALATLFAFYAACDDDIVHDGATPVTVVSIASPFVGNVNFRSAFQALEGMRRIQHLRVTNEEDMITLLPFAVPRATILSPILAATLGGVNLFKHCGVHLNLKSLSDGFIHDDNIANSDGGQKEEIIRPYKIYYPKPNGGDNSEDSGGYSEEFKRSISAGKCLLGTLYYVVADIQKVYGFHSCDEYEARLESCQSYLSNMTLDDLYENKMVVGGIMDKKYTRQPPDSTEASQKSSVLTKMFKWRSSSSKLLPTITTDAPLMALEDAPSEGSPSVKICDEQAGIEVVEASAFSSKKSWSLVSFGR